MILFSFEIHHWKSHSFGYSVLGNELVLLGNQITILELPCCCYCLVWDEQSCVFGWFYLLHWIALKTLLSVKKISVDFIWFWWNSEMSISTAEALTAGSLQFWDAMKCILSKLCQICLPKKGFKETLCIICVARVLNCNSFRGPSVFLDNVCNRSWLRYNSYTVKFKKFETFSPNFINW